MIRRLLLLALTTCALADEETDFTTAPPASWQRVDPLNRTTFDFSAANCRIAVTAPTAFEAQLLGPARAAFLAPSAFTSTVVSADILAWNPDASRAFTGLLARMQTPAGLAASSGYSLTILNSPPLLQIYRISNEVPTLLSAALPIALDRTHRYRLVLICTGANLTGLLFDRADLTTPLGTVTATDSTYPAGRTGLVITTDRVVPLTATFDDFLAWDGTPPTLTLAPAPQPGTLLLTWPALRGLGSRMEESDDLTTWQNTPPLPTFQVGPTLQRIITPVTDRAFFRRHLLGD